MSDSPVRIVTSNFVSIGNGGPNWKVSVFEFLGEEPAAHFLETLFICGTETSAREFGEKAAKERKINFVPGIRAYDSIDKVFKHIFQDTL